MVNRELSCELVWKEISNYIEGDVDASLREGMDDHFRSCKGCASVLAGTRNVIELYGDERMIEVPAGFGQRLQRRLNQSARSRKSTWSTWSAWLVPVAALALIAGGLRWANSLTPPHPMLSEHAQPGHGIPPDMIVVVSQGAKDFHRPGCDVIHNKDRVRTLTAKEAIREGYVPCIRCLRKYVQVASAAHDFPEPQSSLEVNAELDDRISRSR